MGGAEPAIRFLRPRPKRHFRPSKCPHLASARVSRKGTRRGAARPADPGGGPGGEAVGGRGGEGEPRGGGPWGRRAGCRRPGGSQALHREARGEGQEEGSPDRDASAEAPRVGAQLKPGPRRRLSPSPGGPLFPARQRWRSSEGGMGSPRGPAPRPPTPPSARRGPRSHLEGAGATGWVQAGKRVTFCPASSRRAALQTPRPGARELGSAAGWRQAGGSGQGGGEGLRW